MEQLLIRKNDLKDYFLIRNPNEERRNNLPLNSTGLTSLNNFESDENNVSIIGGWMSIKIIPGCSLGGNNSLLIKCLSNVKITLDSSFAISESCLSVAPKCIFLMSKPSSFNNSVNLTGIFSSEISFGLLEDDIFFMSRFLTKTPHFSVELNLEHPKVPNKSHKDFLIFNEFRCIIQDGQNCFFAKLGEIIFYNFINSYSLSEQFKYLPDHYSSTFKSRLSITDFIIYFNISVNFCYHNVNNNEELFKDFVHKIRTEKE